MNRLPALFLCTVTCIAVTRIGAAQQTARPEPAFEVATIKPSDPAERRMMMQMSEGVLHAKNMPLVELINFAYEIKSSSLLSGLPEWAKQEHYDVEAKQDEEEARALRKLPEEERGYATRRMVQKMLEERLHLKLTKEQKEQPVYALVVAKSGVKMKPSAAPPADEKAGPGARPDAGPGAGGPQRMRRGMMMDGRGQLTGTDSTTGMIANVISHMPEASERVVVDKTGLTGHYDFTLKWTPEMPAPAFRGADSGAPPPPASDNNGPTLFTALEEQLGLKLETAKDLVTSYHVESLDHPTAN
ncbi:TIGR03435 family protein [Terriglobus albidus]|uniref:TIGR03435 family protein n=1 Tax=Terriglobus albidus TaxID=1592106 RepID=A0A5B9E6P4_9BACT|nr:TIGR03435 family protein [Terriglobus albidus]QEE27479.1 TIGR03435 family protein [Terriglobus albidus]